MGIFVTSGARREMASESGDRSWSESNRGGVLGLRPTGNWNVLLDVSSSDRDLSLARS